MNPAKKDAGARANTIVRSSTRSFVRLNVTAVDASARIQENAVICSAPAAAQALNRTTVW